MTKRILLGGVLGGIVLFLWGFVSHVLLPLGEVGLKSIPNEDAVLGALRDNIKEPGFYFFPWMEESPGQTKEQQQAAMKQWEEKYKAGPAGILIYKVQGEQPKSPRQLLTQLGADIAVMLVAAFLLALAAVGGATFLTRVLFVGALSLVGWLDIHISYWNWYGFPTDYTLAALVDAVIGYLLAGVVLAWLVKKE